MGAQAVAAGMHLPYTLMTCSANTEISDLVGQFIPDTSTAVEQAENDGALPTIADIIMHPPSVYEELTGVYDDAKTEDDVLAKLVEIAVGRLAQKEEKHGSGSAMWIHLFWRRFAMDTWQNCRSLRVLPTPVSWWV